MPPSSRYVTPTYADWTAFTLRSEIAGSYATSGGSYATSAGSYETSAGSYETSATF